ncbi:MAG: hypothetical protein JRJ03_18415 [Deltaproteobacteria bacterium]|nr:hypothetical protein [Deltaproteobacteria bacterium]
MPNFLKNMKITFISLVKRGANKRTIIIKTGEEAPVFQRDIEIRKVDEENRRFYSIVYAPHEEDAQGDFSTPEEIKKAAYDFMKNLRLLNVDRFHNEKPEKAFIAESWLLRKDDSLFPDEPEGSWAVGIVVEDDELWADVKKGEINALSMGGIGEREPAQGISKVWETTENQIRHRLRDPGDFIQESFRTVKISSKKGGIFLVTGKLKGGSGSMVAQAIRFALKTNDNPSGWTVEEAKAWFEEHKDQFKKTWGEAEVSKAILNDDPGILDLDLDNGLMQAIYKALEKLGLKSNRRGGDDMDEKETRELINKVIEPIKKKVDEMAKPLTKEEMAEVVKVAIKPLSERVEKLEKSTKGSQQDPDDITRDADLQKIGTEIAKMVNEA